MEAEQPPVKRVKQEACDLAHQKKMQHRRTEALRRDRINKAMARLRSFCGVSDRTEKSEVLELSVGLLEKQQLELEAMQIQQQSSSLNDLSMTIASSSSSSDGSDIGISPDQAFDLAAAVSSSNDDLFFDFGMSLPLPSSLPMLDAVPDTTVSSSIDCARCNKTDAIMATMPDIPRSPKATAELLQFASIQVPPLDNLNMPPPLGLSYVASSGTVLDVNENLLTLMQHSRKDVIGQQLMKIIGMLDCDVGRQERAAILNSTRHTVRCIKRVRRKDGAIIWVRKTMTRKGCIAPSAFGPMVRYAIMTFEPVPEPAAGACVMEDPSDFCDGPEHPLSVERLMPPSLSKKSQTGKVEEL
eukprot:TRINITY_DN10077_c0_g2_i2.p1 TRINITY_DN10077_c0_g2~~TRINITY_DN10077_c0_g2_i2.p1  ORF type:complete len:356 (+),score=88.92 TRINITY_DN10077_c0_g2_i2:171-1238(+)